MNTAQCTLGRAFTAFPNTVYNSIHIFLSCMKSLMQPNSRLRWLRQRHMQSSTAQGSLISAFTERVEKSIADPGSLRSTASLKHPTTPQTNTHFQRSPMSSSALCSLKMWRNHGREEKTQCPKRSVICLTNAHLCISVVYYRNASPQGLTT